MDEKKALKIVKSGVLRVGAIEACPLCLRRCQLFVLTESLTRLLFLGKEKAQRISPGGLE